MISVESPLPTTRRSPSSNVTEASAIASVPSVTGEITSRERRGESPVTWFMALKILSTGPSPWASPSLVSPLIDKEIFESGVLFVPVFCSKEMRR